MKEGKKRERREKKEKLVEVRKVEGGKALREVMVKIELKQDGDDE